VLHSIQPGEPVSLEVSIDPSFLNRSESAHLRVVLEGVEQEEGIVSINDAKVKLPEHQWLTEVPLRPSILKPVTRLVFETAGDGYQVDVASIVVEAPATEVDQDR
jgi:hypothetical protein